MANDHISNWYYSNNDVCYDSRTKFFVFGYWL